MKWISVQDSIPMQDEEVLVSDGWGIVVSLINKKDSKLFWRCNNEYFNATHWMPLPELPKK